MVIINAVGMIMAVNRAAFEMFNYQKGELEAKNVRGGPGGGKGGRRAWGGVRV